MPFTARLKSCPVTKPASNKFSATCEVVPFQNRNDYRRGEHYSLYLVVCIAALTAAFITPHSEKKRTRLPVSGSSLSALLL